jgi:hypothetical protein
MPKLLFSVSVITSKNIQIFSIQYYSGRTFNRAITLSIITMVGKQKQKIIYTTSIYAKPIKFKIHKYLIQLIFRPPYGKIKSSQAKKSKN